MKAPLLFDDLQAPVARRLELHSHSFISGPRANGGSGTIKHSHDGGEAPHQHPNCGPAQYVIDQDEWALATGGMKGGARKQFTDAPTGEQLPIVELEDWQKSFTVVVCDPPKGFEGTGGGDAAAARMVLGFRMTARVIDGRRSGM